MPLHGRRSGPGLVPEGADGPFGGGLNVHNSVPEAWNRPPAAQCCLV